MLDTSKDIKSHITLRRNSRAYQHLLDASARSDVYEAIRQGLDDVARARTRPAREVFDEIRRRYDIPR